MIDGNTPRVEREWAADELETPQVEALLARFERLSYSLQVAVLVELELLWSEDAGLALREMAQRWVERAREYGLFSNWLRLIQIAEMGGSV